MSQPHVSHRALTSRLSHTHKCALMKLYHVNISRTLDLFHWSNASVAFHYRISYKRCIRTTNGTMPEAHMTVVSYFNCFQGSCTTEPRVITSKSWHTETCCAQVPMLQAIITFAVLEVSLLFGCDMPHELCCSFVKDFKMWLCTLWHGSVCSNCI